MMPSSKGRPARLVNHQGRGLASSPLTSTRTSFGFYILRSSRPACSIIPVNDYYKVNF